MNRNLVGSIYGRSSIEIANFIPIHQQTWSPQAMLVSDWSILSSPGPKVHGNYCHHLASVNFSHFKLLLRNHGANWNQT
jgi:hypothetical protein